MVTSSQNDHLWQRRDCVITEVAHDGDLTITEDASLPGNETTLTRIKGNLAISGTITSFPDFAALKVVQGNLTIDDITTSALTDLDDIFPELDTIRGPGFDLFIQNQSVVATITGFAELDTIGGNLSINNNTSLTSIPPFSALKGVEGDIVIEDNAVLTTISGFGALTSVGNNISITGNATLSSCCGLLRLVDNTVVPGGETTISGNASGCESEEAIKADCATTSPTPVLGLPAVGEGLRFYPNPAVNTLYIEGITHETSLIIRTFSGKTLLRTTLHQNGAIDLTALPQNLSQGVYLLTLQSSKEGGKEQITSRLVRRSAPN